MKYDVIIWDKNEKVYLTYTEDEIQIFMLHVHGKNYDGSYVMSGGRTAEVREVA